MNTYVPIFRGLDVRGGRKLQTDTHTHTHGTTTVTLAVHVRRGLIASPSPSVCLSVSLRVCLSVSLSVCKGAQTTNRHTYTHIWDNYSNPCCACAPRVNYISFPSVCLSVSLRVCLSVSLSVCKGAHWVEPSFNLVLDYLYERGIS